MEKKLKQKGVATLEGINIKKNKTITVSFKLRYDEILTSVELLQGLNTDITVQAKLPSTGKVVNLGMFTIGSVNFDRDGNAKIPFNALLESVNLKEICMLTDEEFIQLRFMAVIELPDNTAEGGSSEWED